MKKILSWLLVFTLLIGSMGCSAHAPASEGLPMQIFTDDCGRRVQIPEKVEAIVPSGPLSQIILFALAPEKLVGLGARWHEGAKNYIDEAYLTLPVFGQIYHSADLNVEQLAATGAQLIVDIGQGKEHTAQDMEELQTLTSISAVHMDATLQTMPQTLRKLGSLLGKEEKGEQLAAFCEKVYERTMRVMEKVQKVRTLYVTGESSVLAKGAYQAELLDLLTENVAVLHTPASGGTGTAVTLEQIAVWNPNFILFDENSIYDTVLDDPGWRNLSAIAEGNYAQVPRGPHNWMGSPPSVQQYLGMIWLTALLYPEECGYSLKAEVKDYYALFYGCELSDAQYEYLTEKAIIS